LVISFHSAEPSNIKAESLSLIKIFNIFGRWIVGEEDLNLCSDTPVDRIYKVIRELGLSIFLKLDDFTLLPDMGAHEIFDHSRNRVKIRVEKHFHFKAFTFSID
jgi:hypothetical protein